MLVFYIKSRYRTYNLFLFLMIVFLVLVLVRRPTLAAAFRLAGEPPWAVIPLDESVSYGII